MLLSIFIILGVLTYVLLIWYVYDTWNKIPETLLSKQSDSSKRFSIVIPVRNEEESIKFCIRSILKQNYPQDLFEIIVVDDHSTDGTSAQVKQFSDKVKYFKLDKNQGKKAAISQGIEQANYEYIICVDGDCTFDTSWLELIDCGYAKNPHFITGPVIMTGNGTLLSHFQTLDNLVNMAATAVGIFKGYFFLANGANMSFPKSTFDEVKGFTGNMEISSGDDVFLISKIAQKKNNAISFVKNYKSAAKTKTEDSISGFIKQRIRWSAKTKAYASMQLITFQGIVLIGNICALFALLHIVWNPFMGIVFLVKVVVDYWLLSILANYFKQKEALKSYLFLALVYPLYFIFMTLIAIIPLSATWKGRKTKI